MKTQLFTTVLCSLMLLGLGCSSENEPNVSDKGKEQPVSLKEEEPDVPGEEEPNVPGEEEPDVSEIVPVTEYRTECHWTTLQSRNPTIINSKEDFEKCFYFSEISDCPEIDFSKHTLLLASGGVPGGVGMVTAELTKTGTEYILNIDVLLNMTCVASDCWRIALLADKLTADYVKINASSHHYIASDYEKD